MKKILNKLLTILLTVLLVGTSLTSIVRADEGVRVVMVVLYNNDSFRIDYTLVEHNDGWFSHKTNQAIAKYGLNLEDSNKKKISFPGFADGYEDYSGTADYNQANEVLKELTNGLNTVLSLIKSEDKDIELADATKGVVEAAEKGSSYKGFSFVKGDKATGEVKEQIDKLVDGAEGTFKQGVKDSDYIVVKKGDKVKGVFLWRCPKGYSEDQKLYDNYKEIENYENFDPETHIDWSLLYKLADGAKTTSGLTVDNDGFDKFQSLGVIAEYLNDFGKKLARGLGADALGLENIEDMVLNRGTRKFNYYLGIMPASWFNVANSIFWIFEVLAVLILLSSILYMAFKQNYAVYSPVIRTQIQDHVANLIIAIFMLALYIPFFYIIAKTNSLIVDTMAEIAEGRYLQGNIGLGVIAQLAMTLITLVITVKLNITFLTRAITITLLHIIAPVAIASISLFGTTQGTFFNKWWKEMVAGIFMQTFLAIILTMFIMVQRYGSQTNRWEGLMLLFALIPLNEWFKSTFTGTTGIVGTARDIGSQTKEAVSKTVNKVKQMKDNVGEAGRNYIEGRAEINRKVATGETVSSSSSNGSAQGTMTKQGGAGATNQDGKKDEKSSKADSKDTNTNTGEKVDITNNNTQVDDTTETSEKIPEQKPAEDTNTQVPNGAKTAEQMKKQLLMGSLLTAAGFRNIGAGVSRSATISAPSNPDYYKKASKPAEPEKTTNTQQKDIDEFKEQEQARTRQEQSRAQQEKEQAQTQQVEVQAQQEREQSWAQQEETLAQQEQEALAQQNQRQAWAQQEETLAQQEEAQAQQEEAQNQQKQSQNFQRNASKIKSIKEDEVVEDLGRIIAENETE